jgi:hypothetical protein
MLKKRPYIFPFFQSRRRKTTEKFERTYSSSLRQLAGEWSATKLQKKTVFCKATTTIS